MLVQDEPLPGRETVLGQPKDGLLVEPHHLLDVGEQVAQSLDRRVEARRASRLGCRHAIVHLG
jgi:hypothetical protein